MQITKKKLGKAKRAMTIRKMKRRDIDAVMKIFNYYIENTTCNWQRRIRPRSYYRRWFLAHNDQHPAFVLEDAGSVVGFACLSAFRDKVDGYDKMAENTLYISPEYQGRGYGKMLMERLIETAKALGLWAISAWIDSENLSSIAFHKKYGFYETGALKRVGNKGGKRLSVVILQLDL